MLLVIKLDSSEYCNFDSSVPAEAVGDKEPWVLTEPYFNLVNVIRLGSSDPIDIAKANWNFK